MVEVDVSPAAYGDWHIEGAVLWNIYADLKDGDYRLVGAAALERLTTSSGIAPDSTVVCYGYGPPLGLWLMKLHGHQDVRILDCSRETWRAQGRRLSNAASEPVAHRPLRRRARIPARRGLTLDRRNPPPPDRAPPACPGVLCRRRPGPGRNRTGRRRGGRPTAHPPGSATRERLPLPHASPRRPAQPG